MFRLIKKNSTVFIILIICLIPGIAARWVYKNSSSMAKPTKQHGILLQPAVSAIEPLKLVAIDDEQNQSEKLDRQWKLIYLEPRSCNEKCQQTKLELKNIKVALGRDFHKLKIYQGSTLQMQQNNLDVSFGDTVLQDPYGNLVMWYQQHHSSSDILSDLRHLMRYSHAHKR